MMGIIRKFFDGQGRQVSPDLAVSCQEITIDAIGRVTLEANYQIGKAKDQFDKEALKKMRERTNGP